jgi:hypothetical protein
MVGQAVGATGESPKDDRHPAFCAGRRHQILFLFAITFENPSILAQGMKTSGIASSFQSSQ